MKAKDLIKKLETVHPDTEIYLYEGNDIANSYISLIPLWSISENEIGNIVLEEPSVNNGIARKVFVLV